MGPRNSVRAELVDISEHLAYVFGITFFFFLLFCLLFRTKQNLGSYRYLQILMVVTDAAYNTGQMLIQERILHDDGLFAMIPTSSFGISVEMLCAYLAIYNLTFVLIDYSFLYRMWAIKSPERIRLFSNPAFIAILAVIAAVESVVWFCAPYFFHLPTISGRRRLQESGMADFGVNTMSHVMIMGDYYLEDGAINPLPLCGNAILGLVMTACFGFMVYASINIIHFLKLAKLVSKKSIRLQKQLFGTLLLQTVIPLVFLYSPCGLMTFMPLLRIDSHWIARATPLLISFFLPLDTLAVILSMTDYRREVGRLLRCYRTPTKPPSLMIL